MDRLKWSRTGRESFNTILTACIAAAGINYTDIVRYISIQKDEYNALNFDDVILSNDNFYDEDGDPMTISEVLEGLLKPFALRIIQRAGKVYIYDLNSVYSLIKQNVVWQSDDAHLTVDRVYNNAKVTFSPYSSANVVDGSLEVNGTSGDGITFKLSYEEVGALEEAILDGFTIRQGSYVNATGITLESSAVLFDIEAAYSGSDCAGVLWGYVRGDKSLASGYTTQVLNAGCSPMNSDLQFIGDKIFTLPLGYLNYVTPVNGSRGKFKLRINLDLLFDSRYNPFEDAGKYNESGNYKTLQARANLAYIPAMITLRDSEGNALYHLENGGLMLSSKYSVTNGNTRWVAGEGSPGCFWLAYYDYEDRKKKSGLGGWATNKRCIGHTTADLPSNWSKMADGEYIDLPVVGGYLDMSVYSGVLIYDTENSRYDTTNYPLIRWVAYKDAKITLVKKNGTTLDLEEQEDSAYINALASENLTVDTIIGTLDDKVAAATGKGLIFSSSYVYNTFNRAGVTDRLERLLLGTIYSQYASRKSVLSGTVTLLDAFGILGDNNTEGKFLLASDVQDLAENTSQIKMVELGEENYEALEYEE